MMAKDDFVQFVIDFIKDYLPKEYKDSKIVVEEIVKLNDKYLGLSLQSDKDEAAPCVNLDKFYEMYSDGEDLEEMLVNMAAVLEIPPLSNTLDIFTDYEKAKDHLMLRVCNASLNEDYLKSIAHIDMADLAVMYGIAIENEERGYRIAMIKNALLDDWGVSIDQLHEDAVKSSIKKFPPLLFNMADIIPFSRGTNNLLEEDKTVDKAFESSPFYVLTNIESFEGASSLFYPDIMDKAAKTIGEDYMVIPSSIHEVILIPDSAEISLGDLKNMIRSANDISGTVRHDEILGYEPYHYEFKSKTFETAESFAARMAKKDSLNSRIASAEEKLAGPEKEGKEKEVINGERDEGAL